MVVKNPPANAGDTRDSGLIPGMGQFPGGGNGNPLQYSCLGNPMDRGDWWATVHGVAESGTAEHTHTHTHTHTGTHIDVDFRAHPESELMYLISLVAWSDPLGPTSLGGLTDDEKASVPPNLHQQPSQGSSGLCIPLR